MAVDSTAITPITLEEVQMEVRNQANESSHTYPKFKDSDRRPVNVRGTFIPMLMRLNGTLGGGAEGGQYADPGGSEWARATATYKRFWMASLFTNDALESTDMMVQQTLQNSMINDAAAIAVQRDIMIFGDGTGTRATVLSVSGASVTFTDPMGNSLFLKGGKFEFRSPSGTLRVGVTYYKCTSTTAGNVAGFDNNIDGSVIAGDIMIYKGMYNLEYFGLAYHVNSSTARTYQGIDTSTVPASYLPRTEDALGKMLNISLMQRNKKALTYKKGVDAKVPPCYWFFPTAQCDAYLALGQTLGANVSSLKRFGAGDANFDPQFQTISYAGELIDEDEKQPADTVYYTHEGLLQRYPLRELGLQRRGADAEGLMLIPGFDNTGAGNWFDKSQYVNIWKEDFGSAAPSRAVKIFNLGFAGLPIPSQV